MSAAVKRPIRVLIERIPAIEGLPTGETGFVKAQLEAWYESPCDLSHLRDAVPLELDKTHPLEFQADGNNVEVITTKDYAVVIIRRSDQIQSIGHALTLTLDHLRGERVRSFSNSGIPLEDI